jgi:hypothetical protein
MGRGEQTTGGDLSEEQARQLVELARIPPENLTKHQKRQLAALGVRRPGAPSREAPPLTQADMAASSMIRGLGLSNEQLASLGVTLRNNGIPSSPFRCRCGRRLYPTVEDDRFVFECHPPKCRFRRVLKRENVDTRLAAALAVAPVQGVPID